jgi:alpha-ketoglutarate-dependent taurine dioxygenase
MNPGTLGRNTLYVNSGFVAKIGELNPRESDSPLAMLYDHIAYSVNTQCRVQWAPNTTFVTVSPN